MTITALKETVYSKDFQSFVAAQEPGDLVRLRQEAYDYFAENGLPSTRDEEWKYTNVRPVAEAAFPAGRLIAGSAPVERLSGFNFRRNGFTAMNLAFGELVLVTIPKGTAPDGPIELVFRTAPGTARFPHVVVVAERGSKATIIETYESDGPGLTNSAVQVFVEDDASLTHYRVQKESAEAFHIGTTEVTVGRAGFYNSTNINLGGRISRHDVHLQFTAEGGEAFVDGLYMIGGDQHSDTHSTIDHALPNCVSHQSYKGVLADRARGVFNGKVFVRENASGTDAQQSNKNLLLSNDARVDTKPQLEIFNDDVKCSHGATVGQLEDEELFYLLSRGIHESLAKNLLTYGFAEEIINKIGIESIKRELDEAVLNRLHVNLEV